MRVRVKALLWTLAALVVIAAAVAAIGYSLPQSHVVSRSVSLAAPAMDVFRTITDVRAFPSWRTDVRTVAVLAESPRLRWIEEGANGSITFEMDESVPPSRLVSRIADPDLPFGGTWTYELRGTGAETTLTITERGEVYNPVYRFVSRFVLGHTATVDQYLSDLQRALARGR